MIILIRSHDIDTDARIQKYLEVLEAEAIPHITLYWSRSGQSTEIKNTIAFRHRAKVGAGWRNSFHLMQFNAWVFWKLFVHRKDIRTIHAIDLDTLLPALAFARLWRRRMIYEIYDVYSASRNVQGVLGSALDALERLGAHQAQSCILPAEVRKEQLRINGERNITIIENVPKEHSPESALHSLPNLDKYDTVFSYVGIFERHHRGLEDILYLFSQSPSKCLLIAGRGELEEQIRAAAAKHPNIIYFGAVQHTDGMAIMRRSHAILALYYLSVPNHRYASPNKYYEHLALGRPIITSKGTPPGELVTQLNTGLAIDDGYEHLACAINAISHSQLELMGNAARSLWNKKYRSYVSDHLHPVYLSLASEGDKL